MSTVTSLWHGGARAAWPRPVDSGDLLAGVPTVVVPTGPDDLAYGVDDHAGPLHRGAGGFWRELCPLCDDGQDNPVSSSVLVARFDDGKSDESDDPPLFMVYLDCGHTLIVPEPASDGQVVVCTDPDADFPCPGPPDVDPWPAVDHIGKAIDAGVPLDSLWDRDRAPLPGAVVRDIWRRRLSDDAWVDPPLFDN